MGTTPCYQQVIYGPSVEGDPLSVDLNVLLPLTSSHRLSSQIVYGDDEVQPLYNEHTLDLETVIYLETSTGTSTDVEAEVTRIRKILSTPSLQLLIYPTGLGQFGTINVDDYDVKGGPFPQAVVVEPIASNNAILIRWTVLFRTVYCPSASVSELLQYNVEQDMQTDDDGNMEFTVNITYQSRNPITNPESLNNITNIIVARADKSFQGYTKKIRTSLSRDQRIMSVRAVYKEIESDNAFYPNTSNIQITDDIESDLLGGSVLSGKGFYTWKRTIGGTIRLPPRVYKGYAWVVFLKILRERFKGSVLSNKIATVLDVEPAQPTDEDTQKHNFYLPIRIKVSNPLYSREMKFDVTYVMVTDLDSLWTNTNMFNRVNVNPVETPPVDPEVDPTYEAAPLSTQWKRWQDTRIHPITGKFLYTIDGTPIVYTQCTGAYSDHQVGASALLDLEEDPSITTESAREATEPKGEVESTKARYSWIQYDNDFEILEDPNSVNVSFLEKPGSSYYTSSNADAANSSRDYNTGMTLHGKTAASSQATPNINIDRGASTFYVRMKGYAIRAGYKIPIPFITTVGGREAKRTHVRVSQKQLAKGDVPVYLAMWDITYTVVGGDIYNADILNTIKSSGAPGAYT